MFKVKGHDFNAQEVVHILASRLDSEVEVKKFVERHGDRRHEIDEHAAQFALRRRVNSQIHRNGLAPVEIITFAVNTTTHFV